MIQNYKRNTFFYHFSYYISRNENDEYISIDFNHQKILCGIELIFMNCNIIAIVVLYILITK